MLHIKNDTRNVSSTHKDKQIFEAVNVLLPHLCRNVEIQFGGNHMLAQANLSVMSFVWGGVES